jgi:hypothetical protein
MSKLSPFYLCKTATEHDVGRKHDLLDDPQPRLVGMIDHLGQLFSLLLRRHGGGSLWMKRSRAAPFPISKLSFIRLSDRSGP